MELWQRGMRHLKESAELDEDVLTIEQILAAPAVGSDGSVELPWDRNLYSERVVQQTIDTLRTDSVASLTTTQHSFRITPHDPTATGLAVGLTLGLLLKFATEGNCL